MKVLQHFKPIAFGLFAALLFLPFTHAQGVAPATSIMYNGNYVSSSNPLPVSDSGIGTACPESTGFTCTLSYQASAYGVKTNGTDQTANEQAAVNDVCKLNNTGGSVLYMPVGLITQNGQVVVPCSNLIIAGYGSGILNFPTLGPAVAAATEIQYGGAGALSSPFWLFDGNQNATPAEQARNGMRDLLLDGNSLASTGLKFTANQSGTYERLQIQNFTSMQIESSGEIINSTKRGDSLNNHVEEVSMYATGSADCMDFDGPLSSTPIATDSDVNFIVNAQCNHVNGDGFHFLSSDSNNIVGSHVVTTGAGTGYDYHWDCGSHGNSLYHAVGATYRAEGTTHCTDTHVYDSASIDSMYDFPISTFSTASISMDTGAGLVAYSDRGDVLHLGISGNQATQQQECWGNYNASNLQCAAGVPDITTDSTVAKLYFGSYGTSQTTPISFYTAGFGSTAQFTFDQNGNEIAQGAYTGNTITLRNQTAITLNNTAANTIVSLTNNGGTAFVHNNTGGTSGLNFDFQNNGTSEFKCSNAGACTAAGAMTATQFNGTLPNANFGHVPTGITLYADTGETSQLTNNSSAGALVQVAACGTNAQGCSSGVLSITTPANSDGANGEFIATITQYGWLSAAITAENVFICEASSQSTSIISNTFFGASVCSATVGTGTRVAGSSPFGQAGTSQPGLAAQAVAHQIIATGQTVTFYAYVGSSTTTQQTVLTSLSVEVKPY